MDLFLLLQERENKNLLLMYNNKKEFKVNNKMYFEKQGETVEIILHKNGRTDIENY